MIIVTGASKGIGKYLLERFIEKEEEVIGTFHSSNPAKELERYYYRVDVSNLSEIEIFISKIESRLNNVTLINCAGISYNVYAHKSDPQKWKEVIEVNLMGTYYFIRFLLPIMRKQQYGRIINFSSVISQKGTPGVSAYAASKSALWGLTKSLAVENGSLGITINNINLGYVRIGMGVENVPEKYQQLVKSQIPSSEFCDPGDIFQTVEYMRNTSYLNGSSIDLNGALL